MYEILKRYMSKKFSENGNCNQKKTRINIVWFKNGHVIFKLRYISSIFAVKLWNWKSNMAVIFENDSKIALYRILLIKYGVKKEFLSYGKCLHFFQFFLIFKFKQSVGCVGKYWNCYSFLHSTVRFTDCIILLECMFKKLITFFVIPSCSCCF